MGADGKALACIGSFPVKEGDVVYTDGRVVYGHAPIKAGGVTFKPPDHLVPFFCMIGYFDPEWWKIGGYTRNGVERTWNQKVSDILAQSVNWTYFYKNKFYGGDNHRTVVSNLNDFIDVWRAGRNVYTAEFTGTDAPWNGKSYRAGSEANHTHALTFLARNMYFRETDNFATRWTDTGGEVDNNSTVVIKRNGTAIRTFSLGDYTPALDMLKEIYSAYDEPAEEDYKRYTFETYLTDEPGRLYSFDIWCTYLYTQMLSFAFTDNNGGWEMVLLSMCEGTVEPHTVDTEYNRDTDEYEDVYSVFSVSCPVIYYIVKVTSSGSKPILLHQRIVVHALEDNGVTKSAWVNAETRPVEEVNICEEPYFVLNFGDCALTTNLRRIGQVIDKTGAVIARDLDIVGKRYLLTTDPNEKVSGGAINKFMRYDLDIGREYPLTPPISYFGINSGPSAYAPRLFFNGPQGTYISYRKQSETLIERLSIYQFDNGAYLICLRNQTLWYVESETGKVHWVGYYPSMLNLEMMRIKGGEELEDMPDLIADVTAPPT